MSNTFVALIPPAGNTGPGAAVDVSTLGEAKTITVGSSGGVYQPIVTVEMSNDGGVSWNPVITFTGPGAQGVAVVCGKMRMNVSRFIDGVVPTVDLGAPTDTINLAVLNVPPSNGSGTSTDASALGPFVTVQVNGPFGGSLNVDISEDGGVTWATQFTFQSGGSIQSTVVTAQRMRVTRVGVPVVNPGLPIVAIAAGSAGGGGGGGSLNLFTYTVLGTEPDLTSLAITLPTVETTTNYNVLSSIQTCTRQYTMSVDNSSKTLTGFTVSLSGAASAGDVLAFAVG